MPVIPSQIYVKNGRDNKAKVTYNHVRQCFKDKGPSIIVNKGAVEDDSDDDDAKQCKEASRPQKYDQKLLLARQFDIGEEVGRDHYEQQVRSQIRCYRAGKDEWADPELINYQLRLTGH